MDKIKCITFDKEAQNNLPEHIKAKMKADREEAKKGTEINCPNCKKANVFTRKAYKPVSENIAGYCKYCDHVVWFV